jgi:hypothetical protein
MIQHLLHISYFPESITFNAILLQETICKIWDTAHAFPFDTVVGYSTGTPLRIYTLAVLLDIEGQHNIDGLSC